MCRCDLFQLLHTTLRAGFLLNQELVQLLLKVGSAEAVIVADDFGHLVETEQHIWSWSSRQRWSYRWRTQFCCNKKHCIWSPPSPPQLQIHVDHITIGHQWREPIEDYWPTWSTLVDLDHVRACFCLTIVCGLTNKRTSWPAKKIIDYDCRPQPWPKLPCSFCHGKVPKIWANSAGKSKNTFALRQMLTRISCHFSLRNRGYP